MDEKETRKIIDLAIKLKKDLKKSSSKQPLKNKTLAMIFQKPSTRTRVSFETGMYHLGGHALYLSPDDMQLSRGETIEDTAKTLSGYVDVIMARVFDHSTLESLAENSSIPVINGLSDSFHPCQILADLMTIKEKKKKLDGLKICWVGDGNNVCNSLIYGCSKVGIDISIATPKEFQPLSKVVKDSKKFINVELTSDPKNAVKNSDIVMTDTFSSIHNKDPKRIKKFLPKYQVNDSLMKSAKKDAIFMHCLPAKRGQEVSASVIDGPRSVVWDEAENRLHSQKALLLAILGI
ncbi:MAG: ornithine carbamoyltransferase [Nitrosopumilaceae archaeon]|nr:ornithine carbamoyltransferase [Nitrosopumilaceae archaeon]